MRGLIVSLSVLGIFGAAHLLSQMNSTTEAVEHSAKVLRHIVLYKFKDDLTSEQTQEVVDEFAALPARTGKILQLEHGTNVSEESKSEGLTHCFVVTFRNQQDLQEYLVHPAHQEYVNLVRNRREKVVVFDYWMEASER